MINWRNFFRSSSPSPERVRAVALHDRLIDATRAFTATTDLGIKNDFSLRFEVMVLLVSAALQRMKARGETALLQELWEVTFEGFDHSLRQQGVNDIRMASKMRKLFAHATGRRNAYLESLAQPPALLEAIGRNVLNGAPAEDPRCLLVRDHLQTTLDTVLPGPE